MKNIFVFFIVILIVSNIAYSQKKTKYTSAKEKIFFGLTVGPSFPESDFANKEVTLSSGYAKVGYKIQGYGGINLLGTVGVTVLGFTNFNTTDPENLKNSITTKYPGNNWLVNSKSWQLFGGMGGISFYYPMGGNVSLDLKIMSGLLSAKSPELLFVSGNNSYKLESATANSFSYMTSIGLNFYVGQNISLTGAMDFMRAEPNFTNVKTTVNIDGNATETTSSFYREMNIININLGFRYSIR
jgi:hypothetical protein